MPKLQLGYDIQYMPSLQQVTSHAIPSFVCFLVLLVKIHARGHGTGNGKELTVYLED